MFAHIKNVLHLPKLQDLCSFSSELASLQIFMEDIKAQHSSVTKQSHFQSVQSPPSSWNLTTKPQVSKFAYQRSQGNFGCSALRLPRWILVHNQFLATPFRQNEA
jgi:hypothetical protein